MCLCYGKDEKGLPSTPDTLRLGCSYHLHSSHHFLSTWGVVMLGKKNKKHHTAYLETSVAVVGGVVKKHCSHQKHCGGMGCAVVQQACN